MSRVYTPPQCCVQFGRMHCPLYVEGSGERTELYLKWKVSLGKVSSLRVQMALGPKGFRWLPDASCIMAVPRKFPESKKVSKENFRFPKCGILFCRAVDRITRQFPKCLMAMPWIKSFQVYCPSSFLERRMGAHGFRADPEGRSS